MIKGLLKKDLYNLVELTMELLSENPLFFIINSYTTGLSKEVFTNILKLTIEKKLFIYSSFEKG